MNQVPKIKEGFRLKDGGRTICTVYKIEGERVWLNWPESPRGTDYSMGTVKAFLHSGTWTFVDYRQPLSTLFSSQPHNVVMTALEECAKDWAIASQEPQGVTYYLENTDKVTLVKELTDKIHQLGFTIIPK